MYSLYRNVNGESSSDRQLLLPLVILSQILGIGVVVMIAVWLRVYLHGYAWNGGPQEFNVHPLCMTLGLLYLYGSAAVVFRVFPSVDKLNMKILHATIQSLALGLAIVGLVAVFQFHNHMHIVNLYSLHSWCGLSTFILFCLQFLIGFGSFLFPGLSEDFRAKYLPLHRYFGGAILVLAAITAISGINEKLIFVLSTSYQKLPNIAILANVCGLTIIAFVLVILYIIQRLDWMRPPPTIPDTQDAADPPDAKADEEE